MTRAEPQSDPTQPKQPDKALGELFGDLSHEFTELVQTQTELAKTEIKRQSDRAMVAGKAFGGAAVTGYMALVLLSFAVAWALAEIMPEGLAFLIVGAVYGVVALVLFMRGRERMRQVNLVPQKTVESVKEDVQWARQRMT